MKKFYTLTAGIVMMILGSQSATAQAVSGIITDYKGYWKSTASSINATKPDNSHNLLAFTYNGETYSTGVNDAILTAHGVSFTASDYSSLPAGAITSNINGNTKVGLGQLYDGVDNGPSNPAPVNSLTKYLTDGIKGLDIGTCIANLPAGSMNFAVTNINPATIGDGIPDILVTQVADPSNSTDRYQFTNASGNIVGNYKDISFTSIVPVGNWTGDFYDAEKNPMTLAGGFTKTDRPIRLWAADFSDFGITVANYITIKNFKIGLSGNSDVAFVGYSSKSFLITSIILPVTLTDFTAGKANESALLKWNTQSESNSAWFVIEKSSNGSYFSAIDSIAAAGNSTYTRNYSYTDKNLNAGTNYYRLKMVDIDGHTEYSLIVSVKDDQAATMNIYPNPATVATTTWVSHATASDNESLKIYNVTGALIAQQTIANGSRQTKINTQSLTKGTYYIVLQNGSEQQVQKLMIN